MVTTNEITETTTRRHINTCDVIVLLYKTNAIICPCVTKLLFTVELR